MTDISNSEDEFVESQEKTILNSGELSEGSINPEADAAEEADAANAAPAMDQATLSVMVQALKAHEAASELNTEILEDICIEAFAAGKLNDTVWLGEKLKEVTGQDVEIDLSAGSSVEGETTGESANDYLEQIQISQTARIETEEDMKEVLRLHEMWMNSVLRPRTDITADRANLRGANLSGFDLTGVDLRCADFRNATMIGTNLHSAQLSNAWLQGANLQGANLTKANLKRAKLDGTDLREADLTEVDMEATDFSKAILKGNAVVEKVFVAADVEVKILEVDEESEKLEIQAEAESDMEIQLEAVEGSDEVESDEEIHESETLAAGSEESKDEFSLDSDESVEAELEVPTMSEQPMMAAIGVSEELAAARLTNESDVIESTDVEGSEL